MRALITGGAGFIGSHLADLLLSKGWQVDIIDDLSTGRNTPCAIQFAAKVQRIPILDRIVAKVDCIFHLAATVGVQLVQAKPLYTIQNNLAATAAILEFAAAHNKPILLASSSEVYGRSQFDHYLDEAMDLHIGPHIRWGYASAKLVDEHLALSYHKGSGLPVVIARIFNTIGPRQSGAYGMVVPRFINQALANDDITVYGDGLPRRAFTWVGDVVKAMHDLILCKQAYGEVVNIGHPEDISVIDLADLVKEMTHSTSTIVREPGYPEDILCRRPNLGKIRNLIHYTNTMSLAGMLQQIIDYKRGALTTTV